MIEAVERQWAARKADDMAARLVDRGIQLVVDQTDEDPETQGKVGHYLVTRQSGVAGSYIVHVRTLRDTDSRGGYNHDAQLAVLDAGTQKEQLCVGYRSDTDTRGDSVRSAMFIAWNSDSPFLDELSLRLGSDDVTRSVSTAIPEAAANVIMAEMINILAIHR